MKKIGYTGYGLLLVIGIIWGGQFALNNVALQSLSPLMIATGRIVIGFITLAICVSMSPRSSAQEGKLNVSLLILYIFIALLEAVCPLFLIAWGLKHVSSGVAAILMGTVPIFTVSVSAMFNKQIKLHRSLIAGVVIGFIGIVILVIPNIANGTTTVFGIIAILLGACSFAISLILMSLLPNTISSTKHMRNVLGIAAIILIIVVTATSHWQLPYSRNSFLALLTLGAICTGFAYVIFMLLVQKTSPVFAATVNYLIPIIGVIIGNIFMHEHIAWNELFALLCILSALYKLRFV